MVLFNVVHYFALSSGVRQPVLRPDSTTKSYFPVNFYHFVIVLPFAQERWGRLRIFSPPVTDVPLPTGTVCLVCDTHRSRYLAFPG